MPISYILIEFSWLDKFPKNQGVIYHITSGKPICRHQPQRESMRACISGPLTDQ